MSNHDEAVSIGFAITTSQQGNIECNACDDLKYNESADNVKLWTVDKGYLTKDGEITNLGWDQINKDIQQLESNCLTYLERIFRSARDEGHSDEDLVGTTWVNMKDRKQMKFIKNLICVDDDSGELSFDYWNCDDKKATSIIFADVSEFTQAIVDTQIRFFDIPDKLLKKIMPTY